MQLIRKLLFRNRSQSGRNHRIRGLSTAELVGIIVIVGILGALGGTYISGLIGQSKVNAGNQNAQSLNTVMASAFAGGAIVDDGTHAAGMLDMSSNLNTIAQLCGPGVSVTNNGNTITYRMNPSVGTPASYTLSGNTPATYTFTYAPAAGAGP